MRVEADNNLIYDDTDDRCLIRVVQLSNDSFDDDMNPIYGLHIAFIRCYDKPSGMTKQYVGVYDPASIEESISEIMMNGGKFNHVLEAFT